MDPSRRLSVHPSGRYLLRAGERPFFYLGDTAWELLHRLTLDEADRYLADRAAKGYTVIQAVVLSEFGGLDDPTPSGHLPFIDRDLGRPSEAYFADADAVLDRAERHGLTMAILPTWGSYWSGGSPKRIFDLASAAAYGEWLGRRWADRDLIWVLGGDCLVADERDRETVEAMARGLRRGDGGAHLCTYHPVGQYSSADWFHEADWLDFNMVQTGHIRDRDNHASVLADYLRTPAKPVLDAEPGYENIGHAFDHRLGRLDAHQARKFCWWALAAGACGHVYGCNDVWQMGTRERAPLFDALLPWDEAIHLPGAGQMAYARRFIEEGGYWDRLPDPSLLAEGDRGGADHVAACRMPDRRAAWLYLPTGRTVVVRLYRLQGPSIHASWYDPRTGERTDAGSWPWSPWGTQTFNPPSSGDWVLELRTA